MKQKNISLLILLLGTALSLLFSSCALIKDFLKTNAPNARITSVKLDNIRLDSATLLFDVEIKNNYAVALPLVNVDYNLASNAKPFLSGKADIQGTVPAKETKTIPLQVQINYLELLKVLKDVRPGAVIPYEAKMNLSVNAPAVGPIKLPISKSGDLPIPTVPEVKITQIKWDKLSLDEASARVQLHCVNKNQFAMNLAKLSYSLSLGDVEVGKSSLSQSTSFAASGGEGTIEIPISFSPKNFGFALFKMLAGKGSDYKLEGNLDVNTPFGQMSLPLSKKGETKFIK